jgi:N-sulfoglucosamine sulfohydrolase
LEIRALPLPFWVGPIRRWAFEANIKPMKTLICCLLAVAPLLPAADRPNILWITSEDNAWNWLGCYGSTEAQTPRLDALAKSGLLFSHAYSNGPVCAVARSTILNGAYAVTQGTQHMRSRHPIPASFKPHVAYLRDAGYYCTNNAKTDYNFEGNDSAIWDACSPKAHYKNRPEDKPFFAIFNFTISHESSLFPENIAKNRESGIIPKTPRIPASEVIVPPYLPDLPEIRSDAAIYHDTITALDTQVGKLLDELHAFGLTDNTIIFYYGDHGGILPRGKRYLEDTGVRVPMLVHVPEKWRSLSPFKPGERIDEPVAFVDLAPTLLSLVGLERPAQMQGRAFLGTKRVAPKPDDMVFLYADRFDEIYGMRRGITDGRWKYIRCFTPYQPAAPYSSYQFKQAGWSAWRKAWRDGSLKGPFSQLWEAPQRFERLYDTRSDPFELKDLAGDPVHAERLAGMRGQLENKMIEVSDSGIIQEPMFSELSPGKPIADYLSGRKQDIPAWVSFAFLASSSHLKNLPELTKGLSSPDPIIRYWAAQGCLILEKAAAPAAEALTALLDDPNSAVRVSAAQALHAMGQTEKGKAALLAELERTQHDEAKLYAVGALTQIHALSAIPNTWVERTLKNKKKSEYLTRMAEQLAKDRN